jgi:redox-sensitive bicupin YhaK (pirin superfamily)
MKLNHGYATHPTRNSEIILYIIKGAILYKDSRGRI